MSLKYWLENNEIYIKLQDSLTLMKRGLLLLFLLVLIPSVYASIEVNSIDKEKVNIGDKIQASGKILVSTDMFATLKLLLQCEQSEIPLLIRSLTLRANKEESFSESLYTPAFNEGICSIRAVLERSGEPIEDTKSPSFTITKELLGEFAPLQKSLQLGDLFIVKGKIKRISGVQINGFGTLTLKSNGTIAFADAIEIEDGTFDYSRPTADMPPGSYTLEFDVQDSYGNKALFNLGPIDILNKLTVTASLSKETFLPGETIKVEGSALRLDSKPAESGIVKLDFSNQTLEASISKGSFAFSIQTQKNIRSGDHGIDIVARDSFGNAGSAFIKATITAVPTSLKLEIAETTLTPKGTLKLKPTLLDQANDKIIQSVLVEVIDARGNKAYSESVSSDQELSLELPLDAAPGEWAATTRLDKIKETITFSVVEKTDLDINLVNQTLYITNIGNIKFKSPLDIVYTGPINTTKTKKLSLNVKETEEIDLGLGLKGGIYNIEVYGKTFNNVYIEGTRNYLRILIYIILVLLILLLLNIIRGTLKLHRRHKVNIKEFHRGQQTAHRIIEQQKAEAQKPKKSFVESAREFRDRILRDVIKREKEQTQKELRDKFQKEYLKK